MSSPSEASYEANPVYLIPVGNSEAKAVVSSTFKWVIKNVSFTSVSVILLVYYLSRMIYRGYVHPLAKYPGPKLRAVSNLPKFWTRVTGNEIPVSAALHAKYGKTVRLAPNDLSFSSPEGWKDIYGAVPGKAQVPKAQDFFNPDNNPTPSLLFADDTTHARIRRVLSFAFSAQALREQEPIMTKYFDLLVQRLKERAAKGEAADMVAYYNFLTFDILGDLCFGEPFGALENGEYHYWMSNMFDNVRAFTYLQAGKIYTALDTILRVLLAYVPAAAAARHSHVQYTHERVERRMAAKTTRKDIMSYVLRHNDQRGMTHEEVLGSMDTLMIAGSETTATLLSGVTWMLLKHPACLRRLQAEIRGRFERAEDITVAAVQQLPYLRAVLEEALRMYPPVPALLPRFTVTDTVIEGEVVPAGVYVGVPQWTTYHSSKYFANPDKFDPERWLGAEEYKDDVREAFQPFSYGPRNCIGRNLAYAELTSVLSRVIYHFDMELCADASPTAKSWMQQRAFNLWEKGPLMVKLTALHGGDL